MARLNFDEIMAYDEGNLRVLDDLVELQKKRKVTSFVKSKTVLPPKVAFVAATVQDQAFCNWISEVLSTIGISTKHVDTLLPGDSIETILKNEIIQADIFILVDTIEVGASKWLRYELDIATNNAIPIISLQTQQELNSLIELSYKGTRIPFHDDMKLSSDILIHTVNAVLSGREIWWPLGSMTNASGAPGDPPTPIECFVGHKEELQLLHSHTTYVLGHKKNTHSALVFGQAGIGKTALVTEFLRQESSLTLIGWYESAKIASDYARFPPEEHPSILVIDDVESDPDLFYEIKNSSYYDLVIGIGREISSFEESVDLKIELKPLDQRDVTKIITSNQPISKSDKIPLQNLAALSNGNPGFATVLQSYVMQYGVAKVFSMCESINDAIEAKSKTSYGFFNTMSDNPRVQTQIEKAYSSLIPQPIVSINTFTNKWGRELCADLGRDLPDYQHSHSSLEKILSVFKTDDNLVFLADGRLVVKTPSAIRVIPIAPEKVHDIIANLENASTDEIIKTFSPNVMTHKVEGNRSENVESLVFEEIFISKAREKKQARILIAQPFISNTQYSKDSETKVVNFSPDSNYKCFVEAIFQKAIDQKMNIIVFPELSIPQAYHEMINTYSKDNSEMLIVAGTDNIRDNDTGYYHNTATLFYNGTSYPTEKFFASSHETDVGDSKFETRLGNQKVFTTPFGKIGILICSDVFSDSKYDANSRILKRDLDILIILALQKKYKDHWHFCQTNAFSASSQSGIYVLYCNSLIPNFSSGGSALFHHDENRATKAAIEQGFIAQSEATEFSYLQRSMPDFGGCMMFECNLESKKASRGTVQNYPALSYDTMYFQFQDNKLVQFEPPLERGNEDSPAPNRLTFKLFVLNHKKAMAISLATILIIALVSGILIKLDGSLTGDEDGSAFKNITSAAIDSNFDSHMILQLSNANHSYEVGLNSWRFLNYYDAEEKMKSALSEISELKSQSELDVAKINNSLGCLYLDMGNYGDDTYQLLNGAYTAFKQFGDNSLETRAANLSLAQYYYLKGDLENALQRTQDVIDSSDLKKEKSVLAVTNNFRAKILAAQGNYDEALQVYKDVLNMYKDIYKGSGGTEELAKITNGNEVGEHKENYYATSLKWVMLAYSNIGEVYIRMKNFGEAKKALKKAYDMCDKYKMYLGTKNPDAARIATNMAFVLAEQGEFKKATTWADDYSIRVYLYRYDYVPESPELVQSYDVFGYILEKQGKNEEALEQYNNALSFAVEKFGEAHPETAEANNALGEYWSRQNENLNAIPYFEQSIKIRRDILAPEHPDIAICYLNLAKTYERIDKLPLSTENAISAYRICIKHNIKGIVPNELHSLLFKLHAAQNIAVPFEKWLENEVDI